jgi:hypothetical protein
MRTLKRIFVILTLFCCSFAGKAQVQLTIDSLIGYPDSAIAGQPYFITTILRNAGGTPFQGTVQIAMQSQNFAPGAISYLYFSNTPIVLLQNDTVWLSSPNGYVFDTTYFRPGNNVVVVWPYSTQLIQVDSTTIDLYLITLTGLAEAGVIPVSLSPVPAKDILRINTRDYRPIEYVRIFDVQGRQWPVRTGGMENGLILYLEGLPAGYFILETGFRDNPPTRSRFLRLQ